MSFNHVIAGGAAKPTKIGDSVLITAISKRDPPGIEVRIQSGSHFVVVENSKRVTYRTRRFAAANIAAINMITTAVYEEEVLFSTVAIDRNVASCIPVNNAGQVARCVEYVDVFKGGSVGRGRPDGTNGSASAIHSLHGPTTPIGI